MKKLYIALAVGASALGFALLATAFTGESSATAKGNFCSSLDNLSGTVMNYEGLNPVTATNDELDSAVVDHVVPRVSDVVGGANDWGNADDNALTSAYDDLYWAIQGLPGDYTVAQDLDALQPELSAF